MRFCFVQLTSRFRSAFFSLPPKYVAVSRFWRHCSELHNPLSLLNHRYECISTFTSLSNRASSPASKIFSPKFGLDVFAPTTLCSPSTCCRGFSAANGCPATSMWSAVC
uniref:Uncharacterized protein n=1 Tax=Trypanosoma congolense (strain IL3000) TaxID=1068625 RepID=G0UZR7_TRYCI|nr:hypothetical protein, unlikely [Trypanosoma congolense IL3000]